MHPHTSVRSSSIVPNLVPAHGKELGHVKRKIIDMVSDPFALTPRERYHQVDSMIEDGNIVGIYDFLKCAYRGSNDFQSYSGSELIIFGCSFLGTTGEKNYIHNTGRFPMPSPKKPKINEPAEPLVYKGQPVPVSLLAIAYWYLATVPARKEIIRQQMGDTDFAMLEHIGKEICEVLEEALES